MEVPTRARLALVMALIGGVPGSAGAQGGVWWAVGGGAAGNRVSCATCEDINHYWGPSGSIRVGGGISDKIKVGGELHFWQGPIEGSDAYVRGIQAIVLWYPSPSGGFFGQGGLGLSRMRTAFDVGEGTVRGAETGLGVTAGVGWDFALRSRIYLTPRVASVVVPVATIDSPAGPLHNVVSTLYRIELSVTFR